MYIRENNFVIQLIGANHTGKTVLTRQFISAWKSSRTGNITDIKDENYGKPKYPVIAFDPKMQFGNLVDLRIRGNDKEFARPLCKYKNALFVFDDYKILMPDYRPTGGMWDLFSGRWHNNIDFIFSCHSPSHILQFLRDYITEFYIFHTKTDEGKFDKEMANGPKLEKIAKTVNRYVSIYGLGKHPLDKTFSGQSFPCGRFDTTKPNAVPDFFNMNPEFLI